MACGTTDKHNTAEIWTSANTTWKSQPVSVDTQRRIKRIYNMWSIPRPRITLTRTQFTTVCCQTEDLKVALPAGFMPFLDNITSNN